MKVDRRNHVCSRVNLQQVTTASSLPRYHPAVLIPAPDSRARLENRQLTCRRRASPRTAAPSTGRGQGRGDICETRS